MDDRGELLIDELEPLLTERTKLVSITHMSNALGTVNPVDQIVKIAHAHGVPVLLDGSQAAYHMPVDVEALDCDFYAATGHKLYGPTGIGVLYARAAHLDAMPPFLGGGDMISSVTFERSTWNVLPHKFEAGTPHIEGAIGLGVHPHDIGTIVDREGVAIRTGHHCAQPVMDRLGIPATARASLAMYNTRDDIDALARALTRVREVML
jgi:cysteine desulfurase/selenocysteine lyase